MSHSSDLELARYFAEFATRLHAVRSVDDILALVAATAVESVDGCDHSSISYRWGRELRSASSNDEIGPRLDQIQTEEQEGPCLQTIETGQILGSGDLRTDGRWPGYGPRAVTEAGVFSSLAVPLLEGQTVIGAINLFSASVGALDPESESTVAPVAMAAILGAHAAPALAGVLHREHLAEALRNRDVIGQAKGMLMARSGIDAQTAFDILVKASQRLNVKLAVVAEQLVEGRLQQPQP